MLMIPLPARSFLDSFGVVGLVARGSSYQIEVGTSIPTPILGGGGKGPSDYSLHNEASWEAQGESRASAYLNCGVPAVLHPVCGCGEGVVVPLPLFISNTLYFICWWD